MSRRRTVFMKTTPKSSGCTRPTLTPPLSWTDATGKGKAGANPKVASHILRILNLYCLKVIDYLVTNPCMPFNSENLQ